ncbi:hypothetical protein [Bacillus safensis]|uniref:hypothetical protein n=1 Tax=Bacillus safensis TaxID=561879 RepID=UPI0022AB7047|nr:hypothetical protein [Bacillus safensis]WAT79648.1 hypothetical protein O0R49_13965 [Bacillus safensis]
MHIIVATTTSNLNDKKKEEIREELKQAMRSGIAVLSSGIEVRVLDVDSRDTLEVKALVGK